MRSLHDFATRLWKGDLGAAGVAIDVAMTPAAALYSASTLVRNALYDSGTLNSVKLDIPVISIGNIAVGGAGKTPVTAWLARNLRDQGLAPAVLHGGYADDEPALHREMNPDVPVVVGRDRGASGARARRNGANIILLDDGFQHRRLQRDLDVVLVTAESWMSDRRVLPRGPWREDDSALRRAHWIVITRRTATAAAARTVRDAIAERFRGPQLAILRLDAVHWVHNGGTAAKPAQPSLVVTAIAAPEEFLSNATSAGASVRDHLFFPDHHEFSGEDVSTILRRAKDGPIVTTAKDWVKLRSRMPADRVWILHQRVVPEDNIDALLHTARNLVPAREARP